MLHQYRQAYDLFDAGQTNLPEGQAGQAMRQLIKQADEETFRESCRIFTNSEVTRQRLAHYNGCDAEVLPPPLNDPELFTGGTPEGYIFVGGRINGMKRQYLLLEALALAPRNVRLVIAGPPDTPEDASRLRKLVESLGVGDRARLDLRFLARSELAEYVNRATACAYLPYNEDSLGYVTMEAAMAAKPVITTHDSGGVLGLVRHQQTGWVVPAEPQALAEALVQASMPTASVRDLGIAARERWLGMGITWPNTIARLLS
jgi:glycosyltransferase involved in cell wall biosynthesis